MSGVVTIGDVDELVLTAYSGFAHPARRQLLQLLENEVGSTGNVVVQDGSLGYRQATLTVLVESTTDRELLRGYDETGEAVTFIDNGDMERQVLVHTFSATERAGEDAWDVTVTLLELSEPVAVGS